MLIAERFPVCKPLTTSNSPSWVLDYFSVVSVDSRFASQSCLNLSASISLALLFYNSLQSGQN